MRAIFSFLAERFDLPILDWIRAHLTCGLLDATLPVVTKLADAGAIWILLAAILILNPRHRRCGIAVALSLGIGLVVCNLGLKPLLGRIRPYDYQLTAFGREISLLIPPETDASFPSGHTLASFEAATVLMLYRKKWGIPALILAGIIAFSRLYLYVHYPTDVLFSLFLGPIIALCAVKLAHLRRS